MIRGVIELAPVDSNTLFLYICLLDFNLVPLLYYFGYFQKLPVITINMSNEHAILLKYMPGLLTDFHEQKKHIIFSFNDVSRV